MREKHTAKVNEVKSKTKQMILYTYDIISWHFTALKINVESHQSEFFAISPTNVVMKSISHMK